MRRLPCGLLMDGCTLVCWGVVVHVMVALWCGCDAPVACGSVSSGFMHAFH